MSEQEVKAFCELLMRCDIDNLLENIPSVKRDSFISDSVFRQKYKIMKEKFLKAFIKHYIKTTNFEKNLSSMKADFGLIFENEEDSVKHCKSK